MRLIDADEFKKQIAGMAIVNNYLAYKANKMCELIDCQKTAYDVDKVAMKLEEKIKYFQGEADELAQVGYFSTATELQGKVAAYRNAVKIVKSCGIE